jgi:hypothetical protein
LCHHATTPHKSNQSTLASPRAKQLPCHSPSTNVTCMSLQLHEAPSPPFTENATPSHRLPPLPCPLPPRLHAAVSQHCHHAATSPCHPHPITAPPHNATHHGHRHRSRSPSLATAAAEHRQQNSITPRSREHRCRRGHPCMVATAPVLLPGLANPRCPISSPPPDTEGGPTAVWPHAPSLPMWPLPPRVLYMVS